MKILLANPPCRIVLDNGQEKYFLRAGSRWPFSVIKERHQRLDYLPFPFYLAYTASLLEESKLSVEGLDAIALNQTEKEFLEKIDDIQPDMLIFEVPTPTVNKDIALIKTIKKNYPSMTTCFVGPHVSTYPREVMKTSPVDFIIQREYELAFKELCVRLTKNKIYHNLPGLVYRNEGRAIVNEADPIELDKLPFPSRDIFPSQQTADPTKYWDGFCQNRPAIQMHASRGCPFRCNFCLWNQVMYRNGKYRVFQAERVVDEMKHCQDKYGAKEIYFDDDTFTGSKAHVLNICREIRKRKLKISWSAMADAMITDHEMVHEMSKSGCIGLKFGVESGNEKILKQIGKPINFERVTSFCRWCSDKKIKTHATFTFGLSGETRETMHETMKLAKEMDVDSVQFSITTPFPGTRYFESVKRKQLLLAKKWIDYDGANEAIVKFSHLGRQEVVDYCRRASGQWLKHKLKDFHWVIRQLTYIRRQIEGQGIGIVFNKARRALELIYTK